MNQNNSVDSNDEAILKLYILAIKMRTIARLAEILHHRQLEINEITS